MSQKLKFIANKYREFGFNISCITNTPNIYNINARSYFKTPSHPWVELFDKKQTSVEIDGYDWQNAVGIGTFTKWNDLVVIDIDGCSDLNFLGRILRQLKLPENYEWVVKSGSNNGYHIYYRGNKIDQCDVWNVVSTFPPKHNFEKYFDKIEFLWETHTVLPPSLHGSGNKYLFVTTFPKSQPLFIDDKTIYNFINTFFDVEEKEGQRAYGEVFTVISSKSEFTSDFEETDLARYSRDEIYLVIDIETSGLPIKTYINTKYPEILQISWVLINKKGLILKKNSFIINTSFIWDNEYSDFVNIDFKVARKVCFSLTHVLSKLTDDLKTSDYVVAHNIEFDVDILGHYFIMEYGVNPFKNKNLICTMKSTVDFCKIPNNYGYKYPKLSELYFKLFSVQVNNSHNAEIDVLHTLKCFTKLKSLGKI